MAIDSSAALVILLGEAEDDAFATAIDADPRRLMSAVSVLETSIAVESRKDPQAAVSWIFSCTAAGSMWSLLFKGDDFGRTDIPAVIRPG